MSYEGQTSRETIRWTEYLKWNPGVGMPLPQGNIHVYKLNVQGIIFSQTPWTIKVKFYRNNLYEGGTNVFFSNPGHMTIYVYIYTFQKYSTELLKSCADPEGEGTGGPDPPPPGIWKFYLKKR